VDYLLETSATAAQFCNDYVAQRLAKSTNKLLLQVIESTRRALFWVRKKVGKEPACCVMEFLDSYTYDGHTTSHPCTCNFCQYWRQPVCQ
jgi:hypothetical protein